MFRWMLASIAVLVVLGCSGGGDGVAIAAATLAGGGTSGNSDGVGAAALFNNPVNCAVGPDGSVYICDFDNDRIRKMTPAGAVSTLVNQANFARPFGIAFAGTNLYVQTDANDSNQRDATTGTVWRVDTTTGAATVIVRNVGRPRGLLALADGRLVLANLTRHILQILDPSNGNISLLAGGDGVPAFAEGTGAAARFNRPYGMALMGDGSVLVADQDNHRIRRVTMAGEVTTYAGVGLPGYVNGTRQDACFDSPQDVKADGLGGFIVGDNKNHCFRSIAGNNVGLLAGSRIAGFRDGNLLECQFFGMEGFCVVGNGAAIYVADGTGGEDQPYHRVRRIVLR